MRIIVFLAIAALLIWIAAKIAVFLVSLLIYAVAIVLIAAAAWYAFKKLKGGPRP